MHACAICTRVNVCRACFLCRQAGAWRCRKMKSTCMHKAWTTRRMKKPWWYSESKSAIEAVGGHSNGKSLFDNSSKVGPISPQLTVKKVVTPSKKHGDSNNFKRLNFRGNQWVTRGKTSQRDDAVSAYISERTIDNSKSQVKTANVDKFKST